MHVLLLALLLLTGAPGAAATVTGVSATGGARPEVAVALDGPVGGVKALALAGPLRLVVDLAGTASARRTAPGGGAVAAVRIGQFDPETARLVIDLARPLRLAGAVVGPDRRLVLTLAPTTQPLFDRDVARGRTRVDYGAPSAVPPPAVPPAAAADFDLPADALAISPPAVTPPAATPPSPVVDPPAGPPRSDPPQIDPPLPRRGARRPLVVLDAGHGGKDVGTISVVGSGYEKTVTLAIVRIAARELERRGQIRVKLTRSGDVFVPLPQRVAIARAARADLFVSVHADSAPNPEARGASVYTLSETASDGVAARLAARENKADIIAGVNLGIDAPDVGDILIDLVQRDTMNVSAGFAATLQKGLADRIGFRTAFHHFAGFRVLKAADVPSVLLETGYLSNADDARLLLSAAGQRRIGEGIARAIETHFEGRRGR